MRSTFLLAAAAVAILLSPWARAAAPIEDAHGAYYRGHFARSLEIYERLAAAGDAEAAERAGFLLAHGGPLFDHQVQQDLARAVEFLTQAAKAGRGGAGFMLNLIERVD